MFDGTFRIFNKAESMLPEFVTQKMINVKPPVSNGAPRDHENRLGTDVRYCCDFAAGRR
ncbi:MAG TPA: hypothetical protein VN861_18095 [Candidatus Acidoferrales bacterium]|nr:hypothetical protein [Candidatus Acidoferrales bacterium]